MKKGQLITVCPECFSLDIFHSVPISRGKCYIERRRYCNTKFASSEILIIDVDKAVLKKARVNQGQLVIRPANRKDWLGGFT